MRCKSYLLYRIAAIQLMHLPGTIVPQQHTILLLQHASEQAHPRGLFAFFSIISKTNKPGRNVKKTISLLSNTEALLPATFVE
jgi:hypothetical protein